jgi:hypothetical protein
MVVVAHAPPPQFRPPPRPGEDTDSESGGEGAVAEKEKRDPDWRKKVPACIYILPRAATCVTSLSTPEESNVQTVPP